jgi:beta-galactosidase/beta-glucuronidase
MFIKGKDEKMIRLFDTHYVREQRELCGMWNFQTILSNGKQEGTYSVNVPSCWESIQGLGDYRGKGLYTKTIKTHNQNIRLVFKGISHTADIYFDGKHIAHHYNAYTEFDVVIKDVKKGEHKLEVYADNSFSQESALHIPNDYRSYGGITRPVVIEELNDIYIHHVHVTPLFDNGNWKVTIKIAINNLTDCSKKSNIYCEINSQTLDFGCVDVDNELILEKTFNLSNIVPWDCENPELYFLTTSLTDLNANVIDDLIERVGFREIKVIDDKILLNNRRIYIKGFNRHEDYGQLGCAIPVEIMSYDIDTILATGANTIRTSHYPNDERFLDMCDERGVFIWEEAHARGLDLERMQNSNFKKQSKNCINEMVESHYNHPSIMMWGILNECASNTEYGRECYAEQYAQLRNLDKTRPLTSASCKNGSDICLDLADIVSFNIYPLWYIDSDPIEHIAELKAWIDTTLGKGKPLIISEFGAGAIYGYRTITKVKWSEDRQADILHELITKYSLLDFLSGLIVWQYCDCRVDNEWTMNRPKTQNNKGVVDIYRQPKIAYYAVKDCFCFIDNYKV